VAVQKHKNRVAVPNPKRKELVQKIIPNRHCGDPMDQMEKIINENQHQMIKRFFI
jgi:hypothetical protein